MSDIPLSLKIKLGSLVVHCEEVFSVKGHTFDREAILSLVNDVEVRDWLKTLDPAFLPVKR